MREETAKHGTVLIVDEVMTGFRVALGGAQSLYHIDPDITMFGKVIGGGMPVAAFGGKRDIMNCVAPLAPSIRPVPFPETRLPWPAVLLLCMKFSSPASISVCLNRPLNSSRV